jgi:hypothetical protein
MWSAGLRPAATSLSKAGIQYSPNCPTAFPFDRQGWQYYFVTMRKRLFILLSISVLAIVGICVFLTDSKQDLYRTEFELDEASFTADTLKKIETDLVIAFPPGAKGLRFHYKPPIDPIVFAKIEIPPEAKDSMVKRLTEMKEFPGKFHKDFGNRQCKWWPASVINEIATKFSINGAFYTQAHLVQEGDQVILYLKYFTL